MCGICGFVTSEKISEIELRKMNKTLKHRGPDDSGEELYELSDGSIVGLGHNRLSVIDLSQNGHQPMSSNDGSIAIVFNGEIYNYPELKKKISDYPYKSSTDTEVIIAAYLKWGTDFVSYINGMFAIAILDKRINRLILCRDRIGKKPLYYALCKKNSVVFASELKAIMKCSLFTKVINKEIIGSFLYRSYIAFPDTIFQDTYKLEPGKMLIISDGNIEKKTFWSVEEKNKELKKCKIENYYEAMDELEMLLRKSIRRRLISYVPVGAFLSGGYDSTLICALTQQELKEKLNTFSIGFNDTNFNEAVYAKQIAGIIGTKHTEMYIDEKDMLETVDSIPDYYDEPFADSSQIPSFFISKLAREKVTVALTGDGGDELFGGYGIYNVLQEVQRKYAFSWFWQSLNKIDIVHNSEFWRKRSIIYRIISEATNKEARTQAGVDSYFEIINSLLLEKNNHFYYECEKKYGEKRFDIIRMLLDLEMSLPEDMLTKIDRASMRYALECRCPLLDTDIVEFSFRLSPDFKNYEGVTKRIIKDITYKYIPKELMDRPKMGFSIPLDKWLRGVLKEKVIDFSNESFLARQGIFAPDKMSFFLNEYFENGDQGKWSGKNYSRIVWAYLMFQQWYVKYM